MYFVIGFITIVGITIGIFSIINNHKKIGIYQIVLSVVFPIVTAGFCMVKNRFVFGDTDFKFLIQTAMVDKRPEPWIIFALFILLMITVFINIWNLVKER